MLWGTGHDLGTVWDTVMDRATMLVDAVMGRAIMLVPRGRVHDLGMA